MSRPARLVVRCAAALLLAAGSSSRSDLPGDRTSPVDIPPPIAAASIVRSASPSASASASSPAARPATAPLAEKSAPGCDVVIDALLDAQIYRGSPSSQMKWDSYKQNPAYARQAEGMDHGAHYLSCTWSLRVNGTRYHYKRSSHWGPSSIELDPSKCSEREEAEATADDVQSFTEGCKDLHRGEYYGDFLEPQ